jgi:hypothetical protein
MSVSEFRDPEAEAARQQAAERSYRIGLCAARSMTTADDERERFARELQRWLVLWPEPAEERVEGPVLGLAAARRAAIWVHFADPVTCVVLVVAVITIVLAIVEREWWQTVELIVVVAILVAIQVRSLRKWHEAAPGLLPWLPDAGTTIIVGDTTLTVGETVIPHDQIRFDHIRLRKQRGFTTNFWQSEYFLDHVTLTAGGKIIHLDATAIGNGQLILDTLCSRVPLTAFDR